MRGPTKESRESPFLEGWGGRDKGPRREQRPPGCRAPPHSDKPGDGSRCCVDIRLSGASLQGPPESPAPPRWGLPQTVVQTPARPPLCSGAHLLGPLPLCNEDPVAVTSSVIVPIVGMRKLRLGSQASPAAPTMTLWASGNCSRH